MNQLSRPILRARQVYRLEIALRVLGYVFIAFGCAASWYALAVVFLTCGGAK